MNTKFNIIQYHIWGQLQYIYHKWFKEMKPLNDLCWHMYTYKYISIKSLRLFHNYVKHVALHSPDKDTNTKLYLH